MVAIYRWKSYRKKPVVVEATQLDTLAFIQTLEGTMRGDPLDYLICGIEGERYPCKASVFLATYEPVDEEESWHE